jgi:outer membrane lipoprotein-sorting protein
MIRMNRRTLLTLPLTALLIRPARAQPLALTPQDAADLNRVETYLNTIHALKAHFLQVGPSGDTSQGTAWLERPGRMRFEYDPPSPFVLIAGHGVVLFHDKQLNQTSNYPTGSTPLGILLADKIVLGGDITVTRIGRQPGQLQVTLVRTAAPGDGSITLVFSDNPLTLRQWIVLDAQRKETRVSLYDVQLGGTFDQSLFNVALPNYQPAAPRNQ